jgi:hypothetical protein
MNGFNRRGRRYAWHPGDGDLPRRLGMKRGREQIKTNHVRVPVPEKLQDEINRLRDEIFRLEDELKAMGHHPNNQPVLP